MARQLNNNQIQNLNTVLTFRYVTTDNLAQYRNITTNSAYSALEILHQAGYLGKLHDKSYRLMNKSARYYLTQQGLKLMRHSTDSNLDDAIFKSRQSDHKKSPEFIDQQIAIHAAYNAIRSKLGDSAKILTATDTYGTEGIVRPLPGLFVVPKRGKHFFVELTDDQHLFLVRKRIRKYIQNYEDAEWEWETYPDVYIVRSKASDRTRLRKYIEEQMDNNYLEDEDFTFYVVGKVDQIKSK